MSHAAFTFLLSPNSLSLFFRSFDPKDGEAPSEGEDDEDANGFNGSDGL